MNWFVKTKKGSRGPFTFKQMRAYAEKGTLLPRAKVRADESEDWGFAEDVPGLFRNIVATEEPKPVDTTDNPAREPESTSRLRKPARPRHWVLGAGALLMVALIITGTIKLLSPPPFAQPSFPDLVLTNVNRLGQITPPAPDSPTLAIPVLEPQPLLGIAPQPWSKCPSLDESLCELVFIAPTNGTNSILSATRSIPTAEFSVPKVIFAAVNGAKDYCSLSPDGLEILFCLYGEPNTIWHSSRDTKVAAFRPPTQMSFPQLETDPVHLDGCRWVSDHQMQLCVTDLEYTRRKLCLLDRQSASDDFRLASEIRLVDAWKRNALTANGLRAYTPEESTGFLLSARKSIDSQFIIPEVLVDQRVCGPVMDQDFLFVAKQEDLVFYASPGARKEGWENNQLWMLRLR